MELLRTIEDMNYGTLPSQLKMIDVEPTAMTVELMALAHSWLSMKPTSVFVDLLSKDNKDILCINVWSGDERSGIEFRQYACEYGRRMDEVSEQELIDLCLDENNVSMDAQLLKKIAEVYNRKYPESHVEVDCSNPQITVLHMYFCMFRGVRELLFKAGLPYLAAYMHEISDYNMLPACGIGSPVELFDERFTMKLLRLLNNEWGVRELFTKESRKVVEQIYKEYEHMLGGYAQLTRSQWQYMKSCYENGIRFDMKWFRLFAKDVTGELFEDIISYYAKCRVLNRYMKWDSPVENQQDVINKTMTVDFYLKYFINQRKYDLRMDMYEKRMKYLDYSDSEYIVTHPKTVDDIFNESNNQHNCLRTMFEEVCYGVTEIGFMRRKSDPDKSLITFEVVDGKEVSQVLGKYNRIYSGEADEMKWFEDVYMKTKGLKFSEV